MTQVYVIKNQNNEFLEKSGDWVAADMVKSLFKTAYKDEAINQKVEIAVKRPELRLSLLEVRLDEKGQVMLTDDLLAQLQTPANQGPASEDDIPPIPEYSELEHSEAAQGEAREANLPASQNDTEEDIHAPNQDQLF